jgi:hypothetical protein
MGCGQQGGAAVAGVLRTHSFLSLSNTAAGARAGARQRRAARARHVPGNLPSARACPLPPPHFMNAPHGQYRGECCGPSTPYTLTLSRTRAQPLAPRMARLGLLAAGLDACRVGVMLRRSMCEDQEADVPLLLPLVTAQLRPSRLNAPARIRTLLHTWPACTLSRTSSARRTGAACRPFRTARSKTDAPLQPSYLLRQSGWVGEPRYGPHVCLPSPPHAAQGAAPNPGCQGRPSPSAAPQFPAHHPKAPTSTSPSMAWSALPAPSLAEPRTRGCRLGWPTGPGHGPSPARLAFVLPPRLPQQSPARHPLASRLQLGRRVRHAGRGRRVPAPDVGRHVLCDLRRRGRTRAHAASSRGRTAHSTGWLRRQLRIRGVYRLPDGSGCGGCRSSATLHGPPQLRPKRP